MNQPKRGRRVLLLIGLCFAAPLLVSLLLAKFGWMPIGRKNYGELLVQPVKLNATVLQDGAAFNWKTPPEWYWTLLVRLPESCAGVCREHLDLIPNLRTALAQNATKLRIAVADPLPTGAALADAHGVYLLAPPLDAALEAALPRPQQDPQFALVDPNGYVVLLYPEQANFSGVRKDLGKLLK